MFICKLEIYEEYRYSDEILYENKSSVTHMDDILRCSIDLINEDEKLID